MRKFFLVGLSSVQLLVAGCAGGGKGITDAEDISSSAAGISSTGADTTESATTSATMGDSTSVDPATTSDPSTTTTGPSIVTSTGSDSVCGDGILDAGEDCDDGAENSNDQACKSDCTPNVCGDGFVGPGEFCDDGNQNNDDECMNTCYHVDCGDGVPGMNEACDDGNADNTDTCTNTCMTPVCGDQFIQPSNNEECDDGNATPLDGCSAACTIEDLCVVELTDQNKAIPDDAYDGTIGTMICVDLICDKVGTVQAAILQTAVTHTWVGDLTFKLLSPDQAAVLTLLNRPGSPAPDNGADDPVGLLADLDRAFPLTFRDAGATDAELMGTGLGANGVVCKTDLKCDYLPNKDTAAPSLDNFAGFAGTAANGVWKFCVGDSANGGSGILDQAKLTLSIQ